MRSSPIYYLLTQKHKELYPDSKHSQTEDAKNLFLIPVEKPQQILDWKCLEAHVSVYENFSDAKDSISAFHVTTTCENQDRSKVTTHAFFSFEGDFLNCNAQLKTTKEKIELSAENKIALQNISERIVLTNLPPIFQQLPMEVAVAQQEKQQAIDKLEQESKTSTTSKKYIRLLETAIPILTHSARLKLDPREDLAIVDLFNQSLAYSKQQLAKKKQQKKSVKPPEEKMEAVDLTIFNELTEQSQAVKTKKEACRVENIASLIAFDKELRAFDKLREEKLFAACEAGNLAEVKQYLSKNIDFFFMGTLLAICVYHEYLEVFDYIYQQNKAIKFILKCMIYDTRRLNFLKKISYFSGLLSIAYHKKNLIFFKKLLKDYHGDFYENSVQFQISLARTILISDDNNETNLPYLAALLAAGYDPNTNLTTKALVPNKHGDFKEVELASFTGCKPLQLSGFTDKSLLYVAVGLGRAKAAQLLLEHKAAYQFTKLEDCPFIRAVDRPDPNPEIIKLFLQRGKDIDQRYASVGSPATALYHAAQEGRTEAVKVLLELKADPSAEHKGLAVIDTKPLIMTPLTVAARKGHLPIVETFLQRNLPAKQIYRPILLQKMLNLSPEMVEKLESAHATAYFNGMLVARENKNFVNVLQIAEFMIKNYSNRISEKNNCEIVYHKVLALYHLNKVEQLSLIVNKAEQLLPIVMQEDPDNLENWQRLYEACQEKIAGYEAKSLR